MIIQPFIFELGLQQRREIVLHIAKILGDHRPKRDQLLSEPPHIRRDFSDTFGNDFSAGQESPRSDAQKEITDGPSGSPIPFYKRMYPIQPPQAIGGKLRWCPNVPVFLDGRHKAIHPIVHFFEVGWFVVSYVDRLSSKPATKLRYIRNRHMIKSPK